MVRPFYDVERVGEAKINFYPHAPLPSRSIFARKKFFSIKKVSHVKFNDRQHRLEERVLLNRKTVLHSKFMGQILLMFKIKLR